VENIKIDRTDTSPEIDFDFQANIFGLRGMSYQENVSEFFDPLLDIFSSHLQNLGGAELIFNFQMTYFNSISARIILRIFDMLEASAKRGNKIFVIWIYREDDDGMEEQGEDFGEDLEHASFELKVIPD